MAQPDIFSLEVTLRTRLFAFPPVSAPTNDHIIHFADIYTVGSESKEKELEDSQPFVHGVKLLAKEKGDLYVDDFARQMY